MKRLKSILLSGLVLLAASCVEEVVPDIAVDETGGDKVTLTFTAGFAGRESAGWGEGETATKGFSEMSKTKRENFKMRVYVFDQYGLFTEYADATISNPQPSTIQQGSEYVPVASDETVFEVQLTRSKNPRRLHFVAVDDDTYSVTQAYTYGSEGTFMKGLTVSGTVDAYWARVVREEGLDDGTHFQRIPMLRNFAKISLECSATNFVPTGFTIINTPSKGCVAPYNTYSGGFASFYTTTSSGSVINTTVTSYKNLLDTQHYAGYRPLNTGWNQPVPEEEPTGVGNDSGYTFNEVTGSQGNYTCSPYYLYESPNAEGDDRGKTFMIIRGKYDGSSDDSYYKIDITYKETEGYDFTEEEIAEGAGVSTFYNIYRNFNYVVDIRGVTFDGYESAYLAATKPAANNIAASVLAEGVNNVSDGNEKRRLFVNKIYEIYNEPGTKTNLKAKAYKRDGALLGAKLTILNQDPGLFVVEPTIDTLHHDSEDWSTISFQLSAPDPSTPRTATIRVYINESASYETLYRDITIVSRQYFPLLVDCTDVVSSSAAGQSVNVQLLIPDGINKNMFPLEFKVEPEEKSLYPDASKNQLPVYVGKSIVPGNETENSFQYMRTVTYQDYNSTPVKVIDGTSYRVLDVWFKTNTAVSETEVYVFNEYFVKGHGKFENGEPVFRDGDLAVARILASDYYGAGNSYNYVEFKTVRATGTVSISLLEEGAAATPASGVNAASYNLATATHRSDPVNGVYTYRVPFYTRTFQGTHYTATVSYVHDASYTQTIPGDTTQVRRYLFLPAGSFAPTNLVSEFGSTDRFKSGIIYDPDHFATVDPANCGKVGFDANGTTETTGAADGRVNSGTEYEGFTFAENSGYHIGVYRHSSSFTTLDENWKFRFYHSTSSAHNAPDDGSHTWRDDWYAEKTIGEITAAHAIDFQAGASDNASAPNNGLFKMSLTWVDPATP